MSTKTLIILRHAKSDWNTAAADFARPLTPRGRRDGVAAGEMLADFHINYVLCSAAVRTRQTWESAQLGGAKADEVDFSEEVYNSWSDALISLVRGLEEDIETALLIGHQPTLSDLVETLAKPSNYVDAIAVKFPTAAFAVLNFSGSWATLSDGKASLVRFEVPRG